MVPAIRRPPIFRNGGRPELFLPIGYTAVPPCRTPISGSPASGPIPAENISSKPKFIFHNSRIFQNTSARQLNHIRADRPRSNRVQRHAFRTQPLLFPHPKRGGESGMKPFRAARQSYREGASPARQFFQRPGRKKAGGGRGPPPGQANLRRAVSTLPGMDHFLVASARSSWDILAKASTALSSSPSPSATLRPYSGSALKNNAVWRN